MKENVGLGDMVENIIESTVPKLAAKAKKKGCKGCNKRKEWLNNVGAIFSNDKYISK